MSADSSEELTAVQILSKVRNSLQLNKEALEEVFGEACHLPVAVFSICGDKRNGKSLFLNLYARHLAKASKSSKSVYKSKKLQGIFDWKAGADRHTEGIWITSKPFMIGSASNQVALYLMDTQGMFDNQTTKSECARIFALSTLISSSMVFNLMRQIQANDLENLGYWTRCAKWVDNDSSEALCENLMFLIRDFNLPDLGYGSLGGQRYLNKNFSETADSVEEVKGNIVDLKRTFGDVKAFAMPQPSNKLTDRREKAKPIKVDEIGDSFMKYAKDLFLVLDENIKPITACGKTLTGKDVLKYILAVGDDVLGDKMPQPKDISEFVCDHFLDNLNTDMTESYEESMEQAMRGFSGSLDELEDIHEVVLGKILRKYDSKPKFGRERKLAEYRVLLQSGIKKQYGVFSTAYKDDVEKKKRLKQLEAERAAHKKKVKQMAAEHRAEAKKATQFEEKVEKLQINIQKMREESQQVVEQKEVEIAVRNRQISEIQRKMDEQRSAITSGRQSEADKASRLASQVKQLQGEVKHLKMEQEAEGEKSKMMIQRKNHEISQINKDLDRQKEQMSATCQEQTTEWGIPWLFTYKSTTNAKTKLASHN